MRPAASQAASPEPIAIEIEKIARQAVTTSSVPPSTFFTSGGISESATAPTSQNQLVTNAPHQMRAVLAQVPAAGRRSSAAMFGRITEIGRAPRRCAG